VRRASSFLSLAVAAALLPGCSSNAREGLPEDPPLDPPPGTFARCTGAPFKPEAASGWRHTGSAVVAALGDPDHSSQDALSTPAAPVVRGKFSYGRLSKDLEDEVVKAWMWDCKAWVPLGEGLTDSDGRVAITVTTPLGIGVYDVRLVVAGDASIAASTLWILPAGTHLVVTDIDGTMTTSDAELFKEIFDGSYVPVPYPGAVDLIKAHVVRGHIPVYLTGRPYPLTALTRGWLAGLDFPLGALHVTDDVVDALPTDTEVGEFKKSFLTDLVKAGFVLDLAYGNATTDIYAYLGAGIPPGEVWIIGPNAGQQGTHAVTDSWAARVTEVAALPPVMQPFLR